MAVIEICCGTKIPKTSMLDLDSYGTMKAVDSTEEKKLEALNLLRSVLSNSFAADHHRNEGAVNGCIALHVLGYNAKHWFERFIADIPDGSFYLDDLQKFQEHVDRVYPYLDVWGPEGNESYALNFQI